MASLFSFFKSNKNNNSEKRNLSLENPNVGIDEFFSSSSVPSNKIRTGDLIDEKVAMQVSVIYTIGKILSEDIASFSYNLHEKNVYSVDRDHYLNKLLRDPNGISSGFSWKESMVLSTVLRGNGYSRIYHDKTTGRAVELELISDEDVQIECTRVNGRKMIFYHIRGERLPLMSHEMLHYKGLSSDGVKGISPISTLRHTVGESISAQEVSQDFYDGGARLTGVLTTPEVLSDKLYKRIKNSWQEKHEGRNSTEKTALLEGGMQYSPISLSPQDSQFLTTRKFGIEELARPFRIPMHMLGDLSRSTNNNIEHQSLEYVKFCMRPWVKRIEVEDNRKLILTKDQGKFFFEHNMESLLRGDTLTRVEYLSKMFHMGIYSQDDIREIIKEAPIGNENTSVYLTPSNLINREKESIGNPLGEEKTEEKL